MGFFSFFVWIPSAVFRTVKSICDVKSENEILFLSMQMSSGHSYPVNGQCH